MFSKNNDSTQQVTAVKNSTPSIIAQGVVITGNVISQGLIQLDGKIEGEIQINQLTIGEHGFVDGSVEAEEITIKGKITGSVTAHRIIIEKTAQVSGDIHHGTLSIEAGANIDGTIKQIHKEEIEKPVKQKKQAS